MAYASGVTVCEPTWKVMPSSFAACRVLDEQAGSARARDAELAFQRQTTVFRGHGDAHPQDQILGVARLLEDLLELVLGVEREAAAAEAESAANGVPRLDRMHEMESGVGNGPRILKLGQRGDIEMPHAGAVQRTEQEHRAVGLVGVGHVAGKILEEPARRASRRMRAKADDGPFRLPDRDQRGSRIERVHLMGPPPVNRDRASC